MRASLSLVSKFNLYFRFEQKLVTIGSTANFFHFIEDDSVEKFLEKKKLLMDIERRMHFSFELESTINDEERAAEKILNTIVSKELKNDNFNSVIHDYFENFVS